MKQLRSNKLSVLVFIGLFISVQVKATQKLPKADIVVALDGSGQYKSIQEAINAVPDNSTKRTIMLIKNGIYNTEKLIVPASKVNLTILGESREKTVVSYHLYDCKSEESGNKCPAEAWALWKDNKELIRTSATLTVLANNFIAENLTISNTAGPVGQALALTLRGDRLIFNNCNILGYQDTILLGKDGMLNYFVGCLILGRTDYIYGGGIGYFQSCEIRSYGGGWVTAPSTPENQFYGYIFNQCNFTYAANSPRKGDDGAKIAIGRPWHNYPKVAILNSEMCEQMHPEGWPTTWNMAYAATSDKLHLYEYNNTGKGADMSARVKWAGLRSMTAEEPKNYSMESVFGGWNPIQSITVKIKK
ncbi:MAG: pectinesterase family protein [Candidatus Pedobacter colombiensis]|uniref:Pectinesterase family protein n=1 Tax=Candidatus Pedobacter colombiensis TaxID=3121371 RepID=A0AAJ5W5J0_9SPHI|nr:pectinesterase family protein [Pedobacter sp.]WEK18486.1 MAG: pectinesterase family protein [Pedobacter sp.]